MTSPIDLLAERIASRLGAHSQVEAMALAGSRGKAVDDVKSDVDLYVYQREPVPRSARRGLAAEMADPAHPVEMEIPFWGSSDEWIDRSSGFHVDLIFFDAGWMEDQIERVLVRHQASLGYSTSFWHTILISRPLFDRNGWFSRLQAMAQQPYPEELRRAIISTNHPLLRSIYSSFTAQIERAVARRDYPSMNHRTTELLQCYFDILFALNRIPHPGEKRQVQIALATCQVIPPNMEAQVAALVCGPADPEQMVDRAHALVDGLEQLLAGQGLLDR